MDSVRKIPEGPVPLGDHLFSEDEATPWYGTTLKIEGEYLRITGQSLDWSEAVRVEDRGDHFHYLMSNGYVIVESYDGRSIYAPAESKEAGNG